MENKLHLYTGDGKGKTTAAMGLALRALGHGRSVLIAQFMKDGSSGELRAFGTFPGAYVFPAKPISGFVFRMNEEEKAVAASQQTAQAEALTECIAQRNPQLIVLDELATALSCGVVTEQAARALIRASLSCGETVVTGRNAPAWLREMADYVSEIQAVRHPYRTEGLSAREGIEW